MTKLKNGKNKSIIFLRYLRLMLVFWLFCGTKTVIAQFIVKNNNPFEIRCCIGLLNRSTNKWISSGWYSVRPFNSTTILTGTLNNRYYYLYVEDEHGNIWDGTNDSQGSTFSIHPTNGFDSRTLSDYEARKRKFFQVDIGSYRNVTLPISSSIFGSTGRISSGYGNFMYNHNNYQGYFSDYKPNGEGTMYYDDGSNYSGHFYNGLPQGTGTYMTKEGYTISGWLTDGKLDGALTVRANGKKMTGEARNNLPVGNFKCFDESGNLYQVVRFEGEKIIYIPSPTIRWLGNSSSELIVKKSLFNVNACIESQSEVTDVYIFLNGEQVYSTTKYLSEPSESSSEYLEFDSSTPFGVKSGDIVAMLIPVRKNVETMNFDCANEVNTNVNLQTGKNVIYVKAKNVAGTAFSKTITVIYE